MRILNVKRDGWVGGSINIMRSGGALGNPFAIGRDGSRAEVLRKHLVWLRWKVKTDARYKEMVRSLAPFDLLCCCHPLGCHGDNLKLVCEELNDGKKKKDKQG